MTDTATAPAEAPATPAKRSLADLSDLLGFQAPEPVRFGLPSTIALIGGEGTGKTTAGGAIVKVPEFKDAKIAYVDFENGRSVWALDPQIKSEVNQPDPTKPDYNPDGRIHVFPIARDTYTAKKQIDQLFGAKDENGQHQIGALFSPAFDVDIIVVDTLDKLQEVGYDYFMGTVKTKDGRPDVQGAYGELGPWTTRIAWELQNNKPLGILLAHEMEKVDPKTGKDVLTMNLKGGARNSIGAAPDIVARLSWVDALEGEGEEARIAPHLVANMTGSQTMKLKNRYGFTEMWDFSIPKLFAAINAKIDASDAVIEAVKSNNTTVAIPAAA